MNLNLKLVSYNLGIIALLIAVAMAFSLLWALPALDGVWENEGRGVWGLVYSILISLGVGGLLMGSGRSGRHAKLFRREAMAIVGLSWILATFLGALPYLFSQTAREVVTTHENVTHAVPMTVADAIFEAQSGFSTTGATVICVLDHPELVPRCILFWRSTTHFMGGLGIIVLLVALLDTGLAGKFLMQRELTGQLNSGNTMARMRQTALCTLAVYVGICVMVAVLLCCAGTTVFDAICHAFGAVATGGFGTHDTSIKFFHDAPDVNGSMVEATLSVGMFLCGMNLLLLFTGLTGKWRAVVHNPEWRVYVGLVVTATLVMFLLAGLGGNLPVMDPDGAFRPSKIGESLLTCFFHVSSIMTTTGYVAVDYNAWSAPCLAVFLLLMMIGGCAGSTAGGVKVFRYILLGKILKMEMERAYRPAIVRPLRYGKDIISDETVPHRVMVFILLAVVVVVTAWAAVVFIEPDTPWMDHPSSYVSQETKILDIFAGTLSMFGNIGPGLGVLGPVGNYACLTDGSKLIFAFVMMLGRLEIFALLTLFLPNFWRK